ncbi:MAG: phage baseplate assembly protein V [Candidatus Binatia bacterium]
MSLIDLLQGEGEKNGRVEGVALGLVTNNKDDQGMGRVKVRYPWREGRQESYWARIAMLDAGSNRGTFFLPEVGDEVLLAFDKGDIKHPYVLGVLWSGKDKPPATNNDGENNTRKIRSRCGHEITLFDKTGSEKVEIKTHSGHTVILDDTKGSAKIEVKDSSGSNKIVIDSTRNGISVESGVQLELKSKTINIEANTTMNIKAGGVLTIKGGTVMIN